MADKAEYYLFQLLLPKDREIDWMHSLLVGILNYLPGRTKPGAFNPTHPSLGHGKESLRLSLC